MRILLLVIALSAISCNGETNYERIIDNRSSDTLHILLFNNGFPRGDTITFEPGREFTFSVGTSDQAEEEAPDCAERIDSAWVEVVGGGNLSKDIADGDEWEVETDQTQNIPRKFSHTCTFVIRNSDIIR
jgi:hypothetical protein